MNDFWEYKFKGQLVPGLLNVSCGQQTTGLASGERSEGTACGIVPATLLPKSSGTSEVWRVREVWPLA